GQQSPALGSLQQPSESTLAQVVQQLSARVQRLETTLATHSIFPPTAKEPGDERRDADSLGSRPSEPTAETPATSQPPPAPVIAEVPPTTPKPRPDIMTDAGSPRPIQPRGANQIESMIGRRVVGWAAVSLILFATAFFLKYAFDNRWIGVVGRVAIGIAFGSGMCLLGFKYHRRRWRVFSQILTGG